MDEILRAEAQKLLDELPTILKPGKKLQEWRRAAEALSTLVACNLLTESEACNE